ncbi:hypothetical protein [Secundilactobacillus muriivasis]
MTVTTAPMNNNPMNTVLRSNQHLVIKMPPVTLPEDPKQRILPR